MTTSGQTITHRPRRVGIMADGQVGEAALRKLLAYAPDSVAVVITAGEHLWPGLDIPQNCEVTSWSALKVDAVSWIKSKSLDVLLLTWWPHILKGDILAAAPIILNTHPSLLPYCRGKDPNFWALAESAPYGVTIHHVDSSIDGGDIAFQKQIPVTWEDNGGTLYRKALFQMVALFDECLPSIIHGEIPRIPQLDAGRVHYRQQLEPASIIDLDAPTTARELLNRLRARTFKPHPSCRFTDGGEVYEVRVEITKTPRSLADGPPIP